MHRASQAPSGASSKGGQALVMVAVMLAGLVGMGALAVDLGYLYVTRNELQDVSDGAALAGARVLGNMYQSIPYQDQGAFVCAQTGCVDSIQSQAETVASENSAGGVVMSVRAADVAIGHWDGSTFTPSLDQPDAVQVVARRDVVANGPVSTFFARTLGIFTSSVNAIAVAALTGQGTASPGDVQLPIGISSYFFQEYPNGAYCKQDIQFYPTNDPASCAGWTSWNYGSNDATLRQILQGDYTSPQTVANQTYFNFTGGTLSNQTFDALLTLFQAEGFDTDSNQNFLLDASPPNGNRINQVTDNTVPYWSVSPDGTVNNPVYAQALLNSDGTRAMYPDGTPRNLHRWDTTVPVYDGGDCSNPNQSILIVGFAQVELTDVLNSPDKLVKGKILCDVVSPSDNRGGGGTYGIKGSIPGLVR